MTTLRQAAIGVIERWDDPRWRDQLSTARYMEDLRAALEAHEQEPVAYWIPKAEQFCLPPLLGKRPFSKAWEPLYAAPTAAPEIKALQADGKGPSPCARFCEAKAFEIAISNAERANKVLQAKCDAFLANVQLLEVEIEAMAKERDAYQRAADKMAASHKIERDALAAAGKLALEALAIAQNNLASSRAMLGGYTLVWDTYGTAITALRQAGVQ